MNTAPPDLRTIDRFPALEDRQEGKHEFDGRDVIPMTGGSVAHQPIVFNFCGVPAGLPGELPYSAPHEMRIRTGARMRYPDMVVCDTPPDQTVRTPTDAVVIFEVLSDDTATTDSLDKLLDDAARPSLRGYVLLEQTAIAAMGFRRDRGGEWIARAHTGGTISLPGVDISLPLTDIYRGLAFVTA